MNPEAERSKNSINAIRSGDNSLPAAEIEPVEFLLLKADDQVFQGAMFFVIGEFAMEVDGVAGEEISAISSGNRERSHRW